MPKLCTGCGLTTDDDGSLIAAVSGTFPYTAACGASGGGKVYCSAVDGKLYVDPPPMFRLWRFVNEIQGSGGESDDLTDYGVTEAAVSGGNVTKTFTATAGTVTNPSSCVPMQLFVEIGIQHALFTIDSGGPSAADSAIGDVQIEAYYTLSGGITAFEQGGGHQHWGGTASNPGGSTNREILRFDSSGAFLDLPGSTDGTSPFVLAPEATVTITSVAKLIVLRYVTTGSGRVKLENWRNTIRVTGWAGA